MGVLCIIRMNGICMGSISSMAGGFATVYALLLKLICFVVITRMLLLVLPGKKYYMYMKLLIGFCIMILLISYMNQALSGLKFSENSEPFRGQNKLNEKEMKFDKYAKIGDSSILSTVEQEIKRKLNNQIITDKIMINSVEIEVCEDVESVNYDKIVEAVIEISTNVDKSVNIEVNNIIVGQKDKKSENSEQNDIKIKTAEMLGIEEAHVIVVRGR